MSVPTLPPSAEDILLLAERALAAIPARLARHAMDVRLLVEDAADDETLAELDVENSWDLTGLYRGTPLHLQSVQDIARQSDLIVLYREPILLEWIETDEDLFRLVRNVVVHEIAHHFGFSDTEIALIEAEMR